MANKILTHIEAAAAVDIDIGGLAAGAGVHGAALDNSTGKWPAALVGVSIMTGSVAPVLNEVYDVYLLRDMGNVADDAWDGTKGAGVPLNATPLGSVKVTAATATSHARVFDTSACGPLGPSWSIAIYNRTSQAADVTNGNHKVEVAYYAPEVQ